MSAAIARHSREIATASGWLIAAEIVACVVIATWRI